MKIRTDTVVSEAAYDPKHIKTPTHLIKLKTLIKFKLIEFLFFDFDFYFEF
jgi:hypothetical protein